MKNQVIVDIINKCGGLLKVCEKLDVTPTTVQNWIYRFHSIPRPYWESLYEMSAMQVSLEELAGWGVYKKNLQETRKKKK